MYPGSRKAFKEFHACERFSITRGCCTRRNHSSRNGHGCCCEDHVSKVDGAIDIVGANNSSIVLATYILSHSWFAERTRSASKYFRSIIVCSRLVWSVAVVINILHNNDRIDCGRDYRLCLERFSAVQLRQSRLHLRNEPCDWKRMHLHA